MSVAPDGYMLYMGKDKFENEVRSHSSVYVLFVNKRAFASAVGVRLSELSELEHLSTCLVMSMCSVRWNTCAAQP